MGSVEPLVARGRAYSALGAMFRSGPGPEDLEWLGAVPVLSEAVAGRTADDLAAEHHRITAFEVFPHEAVFLHPEALRGGPVVEEARQSFLRLGLSVEDDRADHLGSVFGGLGFLCLAEAEAVADGKPEQAHRMQHLAAELIDHRGGWLPIVLTAIQRTDSALYAALAELAEELIWTHRAALDTPVTGTFQLPAPEDVLANEKSGFKQITRHLTIPVHTGWWLSKADVLRVGQSIDLPCGFDTRARMLENLWFTARDHGKLAEMLAGFDAVAAEWDRSYEVWVSRDAGGLSRGAGAWRTQLASTRRTLARIAEQV